MKILIVSWYFPPANDVAALRVGKLAEHFRDGGHDVWLLTAERKHLDESLSTSFPPDRIIRTRWFDVDTLRVFSPQTKSRSSGGAGNGIRPVRSALRRKISAALTDAYVNIVHIPDRQIGWLSYLKRAGTELLKREKIDLIYASAPPFTTFLAAKWLSKRFSVPWLAEYRDAWSRYVYMPRPLWRQAIDERMENRTTPTASGIVTVTEPWAHHYAERFGLPTIAAYNGFDPENVLPHEPRTHAPDEPLSIVYMGSLYQGLRDPSLLYELIRRAALTPRDIRVFYYGPEASDVYPLAEKFGVTEFVTLKDRVPYRTALAIQQNSDVLLLLQSPLDPRNVPAKIFEYLAARRPIIGLGLDTGIPADLIRQRGAGIDGSDAGTIADQLKRWVAEKRASGAIPRLPETVPQGLSRREQFARIDTFLLSVKQEAVKPAGLQ